jgi:translation initiation factor IF-2
MMTVMEYAQDVNRKVEEILNICKQLKINVKAGTCNLKEDDIVELDSFLAKYDEEAEIEVEEILKDTNIDFDNTISLEKLKKKADVVKTAKKDFQAQKKEMYKNKEKLMVNSVTAEDTIFYKENMTIKELSDQLGISSGEVIKKLFLLGIMANINTTITFEQAELVVIDYNKQLKKEETRDVKNFEEYEVIDHAKDLAERPPVVTIMGHVDHGKTTLLDSIRNADVVSTEAGGITQAISAYQVAYKDKKITFIDTPGHAAFTEMRARGASITDIVIIIVAADDGVMPQTKEAIDHAKAAKVPIIVAINKMDKPGANPERIMKELSEYGLVPDEWGGNTLYSKIVAKDGKGIDELLENILLVAEMEAYKANPSRYALGSVVESRLDRCLGPVVTLIIQNGTLRLGDPIVVGCAFGKVRTLKNDKGEEITEALPSQPVEITGLSNVPVAGDKFMAFETDKEARAISEYRTEISKLNRRGNKAAVSLDELFSKIQEGIKEINVIIKADVHGSGEAIKMMLEKLEVKEVRVKVVRSSVGSITESDIVLAKASNAIVIGFNVRPGSRIKDYAQENNVEIRLYDIIYKIVEDMEAAMKGMLEPVFEEKIHGTAEVRQLFKFSKVGTIAGSHVSDGLIKRGSKVRIIRDGVVIFDGKIDSIQREKETVKEVKKGLECGITIENYNDLKIGDVIESYELVEINK